MKKQNLKNKISTMKASKGITLVALIITIIVLLILAVVAISAVNNTEIIQHAKNSADEYTDGRDEENIMIGNYLDIINNYKPGEKTQDSEPVSIVGKYGDDAESSGTTKLFEYYLFNEDGTGVYGEDHGSVKNFTYNISDDGNGIITFKDNTTERFIYESSETNKIIYFEREIDGFSEVYTTNGTEDLSLIQNTTYKLYEENDYIGDIKIDGKIWTMKLKIENEDTGEMEEVEESVEMLYFKFKNYIFINTKDGDGSIILENVFDSVYKIEGDKLIILAS